MIEATEEQVRYFRARRGLLAGAGAPDPVAAARGLLGAQAQQPGPALLALSQRTAGRPTAAVLRAMLTPRGRSAPRLVRAWGQRETLHVYDPADWAWIAAAREQWAPAGRPGPLPDGKALQRALAVVQRGGTAARSDLLPVVPKSLERGLLKSHAKYIKTAAEAKYWAAGRLVWALGMRGDTCVADKTDAREQAYAARTAWFPKLKWPDLDPGEAAAELTRRYLALNGPATTKDVAHYFGARIREAAGWVDALAGAGELVDVACGDRKGLCLLAADATELRRKPPASAASWPVRLLPQWDTLLMGHADKSWTVPDESERKLVWRSQAVVAAAVLARGRVVAEWRNEPRRGRLAVTVLPLSGWRKAHLAGVRREAAAVAAHLELDGADVAVE